ACALLCFIASRSLSLGLLSDFFFQAEDGIRDFHVTGVQTCALPISILPLEGLGITDQPSSSHVRDVIQKIRDSGIRAIFAENVRSEERRVGKECRSRWSPDD